MRLLVRIETCFNRAESKLGANQKKTNIRFKSDGNFLKPCSVPFNVMSNKLNNDYVENARRKLD